MCGHPMSSCVSSSPQPVGGSGVTCGIQSGDPSFLFRAGVVTEALSGQDLGFLESVLVLGSAPTEACFWGSR